MDTIVEQDVINKLKVGDVVLTKQEQKIKLLSYLGNNNWYCCVDDGPHQDGIIFSDQIICVLSSSNG